MSILCVGMHVHDGLMLIMGVMVTYCEGQGSVLHFTSVLYMCKLHEADSYGEFYTCVSCMKQTAMESFIHV